MINKVVLFACALFLATTSLFAAERMAVVRKGDTIITIAKRYKTTDKALIRINNFKPPYRIYIGQRIKLPPLQAPPRPATVTHKRDNNSIVPRRLPETKLICSDTPAPEVTSHPMEIKTPNSPTIVLPTRKPLRMEKPVSKGYTPPEKVQQEAQFLWPVEGEIISHYGKQNGGTRNDGINIEAFSDAPIVAAADGEVVYAGSELRGFGNMLLIKHDGGWMTAYAHAKELLVKEKERVTQGQMIAKVGQTGSVDTPQLHFELRRDTKTLNPVDYMVG